MKTMYSLFLSVLVSMFLTQSIVRGADASADPWDVNSLKAKAPTTSPATDVPAVEGLKELYFEGPTYHGKPTKVFAWIGLPKGASAVQKVPAIVLVHGGGGTAFDYWVKLWNARGYAAIAMDVCGAIPVPVAAKSKQWKRHEASGPVGWGGFKQVDEPAGDQWTYHAVADVILANSLLRSLPEVDADRIGITGISWGGFLTCIVAGLDDRFRFAAPVYGCGFINDNSTWLDEFQKLGPERTARWVQWWEPSRYLPRAGMPMLWVDGTNDFAYPLDSLQRSYRLPKSPRSIVTRVRMPHGHHGPGENPPEILAFADSVVRSSIPLAQVGEPTHDGGQASVSFNAKQPMVTAELNYTLDRGEWKARKWQTMPAVLVDARSKASATLPAGTTVFFFNLIDKSNWIASSEHVELLAGK